MHHSAEASGQRNPLSIWDIPGDESNDDSGKDWSDSTQSENVALAPVTYISRWHLAAIRNALNDDPPSVPEPLLHVQYSPSTASLDTVSSRYFPSWFSETRGEVLSNHNAEEGAEEMAPDSLNDTGTVKWGDMAGDEYLFGPIPSHLCTPLDWDCQYKKCG